MKILSYLVAYVLLLVIVVYTEKPAVVISHIAVMFQGIIIWHLVPEVQEAIRRLRK